MCAAYGQAPGVPDPIRLVEGLERPRIAHDYAPRAFALHVDAKRSMVCFFNDYAVLRAEAQSIVCSPITGSRAKRAANTFTRLRKGRRCGSNVCRLAAVYLPASTFDNRARGWLWLRLLIQPREL
jgi:hypothetical protein